MRSICWYIIWYKFIIGVIYLLLILWNDMIYLLILTFKNIFWFIYDIEYFMILIFLWWDINASGLSRVLVWFYLVMRLFGCSSFLGLVEVNFYFIFFVLFKFYFYLFIFCLVFFLFIILFIKILFIF